MIARPWRLNGLLLPSSCHRLGYRMGMCAVLALWVCWDCIWGLIRSGHSTIGGRTAFPVFRACGGLLLLQWFWGCSVFMWTRYRYVSCSVRLMLHLFRFLTVIRRLCPVSYMYAVSIISICSISTPELSIVPWESSMMQWTTRFFSFGVCSCTTRYRIELRLCFSCEGRSSYRFLFLFRLVHTISPILCPPVSFLLSWSCIRSTTLYFRFAHEVPCGSRYGRLPWLHRRHHHFIMDMLEISSLPW
jgi:hypothetical protein